MGGFGKPGLGSYNTLARKWGDLKVFSLGVTCTELYLRRMFPGEEFKEAYSEEEWEYERAVVMV